MTTLGEKHLTSTYDMFGRLTSQMWDTTNMFTTSYGYRFGSNNTYTPVIESIRNNGRGISYLYDIDGNIKEISTDWTKITYEYDNFGQLIRVNDNDTGHTTLYTYNAGCNMVSEKCMLIQRKPFQRPLSLARKHLPMILYGKIKCSHAAESR